MPRQVMVAADAVDPAEYGGAPLLGVNGVCIIAHGASSALAIKNAILAATQSIKNEINPQILREVQSYNEKSAATPVR